MRKNYSKGNFKNKESLFSRFIFNLHIINKKTVILGLFLIFLISIFTYTVINDQVNDAKSATVEIRVCASGCDYTSIGTAYNSGIPADVVASGNSYVITVSAGTYVEDVQLDGKTTGPSNTITIQNYSNDRPIVNNNQSGVGFNISDDYVTVKGFEITNNTSRGVQINNSNYVTLEDNWIHDNVSTQGSIRCDGASSSTNNVIHNNKIYNGVGFYCNCDDTTISNNEVYNTSIVGIF